MHLIRCHLDHYPILLETHPRASNGRGRPFKFQNCWLLDSTFHLVVSQAWGQALRLKDAINRFTRDASAWIKTHFWEKFYLEEEYYGKTKWHSTSCLSQAF